MGRRSGSGIDGGAESTIGFAANEIAGEVGVCRKRLRRMIVDHDDLERPGRCLGLEITKEGEGK
jgi:hypothetical protein